MSNLTGDVPLAGTYFDLNAKRGTLSLKEHGSSHEENIMIVYIEFLCRGQGPCRVHDYSHFKNNPEIRKMAYIQVKAMGFEDDKHCFVLTTISTHYKSQPRIVCIIDLN